MKYISKKHLLTTTAIMAAAIFTAPNSYAQSIPSNSWDYDTVLGGNVNKDVSTAGITNITVSAGNGFVEGNADIYADHVVNVIGENGASFAYRDNRDNIETSLNGSLNSNMQIVIIDKDGMFFGSEFSADVQGIVATTGDVAVNDIINGGSLNIQNIEGDSKITIDGTITVAQAGLAAFVAPNIENNGYINAKLGRVQMGAADIVTVDLYGDGLLELAVGGELSDALIENSGDIISEGGTIQISAIAAKNTVDNIINNTGVISVKSVEVADGKIILSGGNKGTIRNQTLIEGGEVSIEGERFAQNSAISEIFSDDGLDINIKTSGDVNIENGSINANGGNIIIDNDGTFNSTLPETLKTKDNGNIFVRQNAGGSIQNAIDAIDNTGSGSNTIEVGAGTYNESLVADHENLILSGNNSGIAGGESSLRSVEESIIAPNSPGVYISADNVTIDGFLITGADEAIWVDGANNAQIKNNVINNSLYGGFFENSSNSVIRDNLIDGAMTAVYGNNATNLWVYDNDILNSVEIGIHVENSAGTDYINDIDIWKNRIVGDGGAIGIFVDNSAYASIGGYNNNQFGEIDSFANANIISGVTDGIKINNSDKAVMIYNTINDTTGDAINVLNSDKSIIDTNIIEFADSGIYVSDSDNVNINNNEISNVSAAISADNTLNIKIDDNYIINYDLYAIAVSDSSASDYLNAAKITNNILFGKINSTAISLENSAYASIGGYYTDLLGEDNLITAGNVIAGGRYGIEVVNSNNSVIAYNDISGIDDIAISLGISDDARIYNNILVDSYYGIDILDANNTIVRDNFIIGAFDGIYANNAKGAWIYNNEIVDLFGTGIYVVNSDGTDYINDVDIWKNRIYGGTSESIGILVENSAYASIGGYNNNQFDENDSFATGNVITGVSDAIVIDDSDKAIAIYNNIKYIDGTGITITNSNSAVAMKNYIYNPAIDGVYADNASNLWVYDNDIIGSFDTGIHVVDSSGIDYINDIDIWKNRIEGEAHATGILVEDSNFATIGGYLNNQFDETDSIATGNVISGTGTGISLISSYNSVTTYNTINDVLYNGIYITSSRDSIINYNEIDGAGRNGILAVSVIGLNIDNNTVSNSNERGIYISGPYNGYVSLSGNILTNNGYSNGFANMRFESGQIDISNIDAPNIITNTITNPAIGLQFYDRFKAPNSTGNLSIVGNTLGSTIFNGFLLEDSFYVRIEDNSILDAPNTPIVIDGTNVSFDGIIPASSGNILSASDLSFIENRLYDADDAPINGRGQIFTGATIEDGQTIENFEDFFPPNNFDTPNISGGAILTINGLPPINDIGAAALNNIAPNAGDNNNEADDINDPENLANIEPAAGEDGNNNSNNNNVTCLGDVIGALPNGQVTYSFGGTLKTSLIGEVSCSSTEI